MMESLLGVLGWPLLACVLMVAMLGYLGLHVLKREIVFIDIALAQIAAVGAVAAHVLLGAHEDSFGGEVLPLAVTLLAAAFYAVVRRYVSVIALEAVIGISYGVAAAAALLLLGVAPGGHVHVQHMLAGSILWTTPADLATCAIVFALVGAAFFACHRPFHRISAGYDEAVRSGMRVTAWDFLFYSLVGVVVTVAVRIGGVVLVFGFLIIPATLAALFTDRTGARVAIAWGAGLAAAAAGLVFAGRLDFSVGPSVALFLGVVLGLGALFRRHAATGTLAGVAVVAGLVLLALHEPGAGGSAGAASRTGRLPCVLQPAAGPGGEVLPPAAPNPVGAASPDRIEDETDPAALRSLFARDNEPDVRARIVCRLLALAPPEGISLALGFLETDPPLYFRQTVVDALVVVEPKAADFEVSERAAAEVNRRTAAAIRARLSHPR